MSSTVRALIKALGMQAENLQREHRGESMAYVEEAFTSLIDDKDLTKIKPTPEMESRISRLLWDTLKRDPEHKDRRFLSAEYGTKTKRGLLACILLIINEETTE